MKTQLNSKNSGSAIVVVLSITVTVAIIVAVSMEYTATIRRYVQRSQALQSAVAIGDGALESAFSYWRGICRSSTDIPLPTSAFAYPNIPLPTQTQFPNVPGFTAQLDRRRSESGTSADHYLTIAS